MLDLRLRLCECFAKVVHAGMVAFLAQLDPGLTVRRTCLNRMRMS